MNRSISRRELINHASLCAGLAAVGGVWSELPVRASNSPNEKLNIASIGVGGQGAGDIGNFTNENIVALCDVDDARAADTFNRFPQAKRYRDFRKMLDEMGKSIDAVSVSTPDHVHAIASIHAMKAGKHVYCQKPLAHSVWECRMMAETAKKAKVATQMGTQGHAFDTNIRAVELLEKGAIGPVKEVHVITDRPAGWWPQGVARPSDSPPVPATLDWDLWLGPAPQRPYNPAYLPFVWRGWWDFGTGALGDMACHLCDVAFWALRLGAPTRVSAQGEPKMADTAPLWSVIEYDFPARGSMPAVKMVWYDGGKRPSNDVLEGMTLAKDFNGSMFIGEKGKLFLEHSKAPKLLPESTFSSYTPPSPYLPRPASHYQQWIDACKSGTPTGSNFGYAGPMTEALLLGNLALRTGKVIEWDSRKMAAKGCPEAEPFIKPRFRKGWIL